MTTTVTSSPIVHHPRRRIIVSAGVVAVLALGAGAAAGRVTSSDSSTSSHTGVVAPATNVDAQALWDQLSTMSAAERDNVVAGLTPAARARLRAIGQELATVAAH